MDSVGLVVFAGGGHSSNRLVEEMQSVRQACARDLLMRAVQAAAYDPIILVARDPAWASMLQATQVIMDYDATGTPFHFGRRLSEVIAHYQLERVLYLGAASAPLLGVEDLQQIAAAVCAQSQVVIANNINSTDWAAISPAGIVSRWIDRLETDNALGWVLSHDAGLQPIAWRLSPATRLDIDIPIDAQIAALHPQCGPYLRDLVQQLNWDNHRLEAARAIMMTPATRVILAGRVPAWAWAQMEKATQCWTRVYSEERGMRASGRLQAGGVQSLLYDHLRAVGLQRFMEELCSMADAILWDTRVLWAAHGVWPAEEDRYAADLGLLEGIADPFIREFTQAVHAAPIPIVTGGHALVSGGLWTLLESLSR